MWFPEGFEDTPFSHTTVQRRCLEKKADVLGFILKLGYSEKATKISINLQLGFDVKVHIF